ncbi:hypothetical protein [Kitasatospora sp. NPDC088346]|uniref:hypothetical protein n=1 Tax=Kitasatospora sp. NPDC088346 TaxID=3364073 RepID=UPI003804926D
MPAEHGGLGWTLVPDPDAVAVIERIVRELLEGRTVSVITAGLNEDGRMTAHRHFMVSEDTEDDAYGIMFRLASVLVRAGITERYGKSVRRIPSQRHLPPGWGVYLVDRMADQPTPAGLALVTTVRHTRALAAELVALAA